MNKIIEQAFELKDDKLVLKYGFNSGGYEKHQYFLTADGGILSIEAVQENWKLCNDPDDPQWYVIHPEVNYEHDDLVCDHTGEKIEPVYP